MQPPIFLADPGCDIVQFIHLRSARGLQVQTA
jgi:hypothetical protein